MRPVGVNGAPFRDVALLFAGNCLVQSASRLQVICRVYICIATDCDMSGTLFLYYRHLQNAYIMLHLHEVHKMKA